MAFDRGFCVFSAVSNIFLALRIVFYGNETQKAGMKMATVINAQKKSAAFLRTSKNMDRICSVLPRELFYEISEIQRGLSTAERIEEIRLRRGKQAYLTLGGANRRNFALSSVTDGAQLSRTLEKMCDGSLYAYSESITKGYVSLGGGIRVGVCGRASVEDGRILGIYDISALNIRLPCANVSVAPELLAAVRDTVKNGAGVLVYSPPGEGKTTLLRSLSYLLSHGDDAMRVCAVDSRDELASYIEDTGGSLEIMSGYPKAEGIRIATAFMNPQLIVCDEIGDADEARSVAEAQNCGVPLLASTHGSSIEGILRRAGMRSLCEAEVFGLYVGIKMRSDGMEYSLRTRGDI